MRRRTGRLLGGDEEDHWPFKSFGGESTPQASSRRLACRDWSDENRVEARLGSGFQLFVFSTWSRVSEIRGVLCDCRGCGSSCAVSLARGLLCARPKATERASTVWRITSQQTCELESARRQCWCADLKTILIQYWTLAEEVPLRLLGPADKVRARGTLILEAVELLG